jgi:hypothetical protein
METVAVLIGLVAVLCIITVYFWVVRRGQNEAPNARAGSERK